MMIEKCFECDRTDGLCNHHIIPKSLGGKRTVKLCEHCHWLAHGASEASKPLFLTELRNTARNTRGKKDGEKGGRVPVGYKRVFDNGKATGQIVIDPFWASVVQRIFSLRSQGLTIRAICAELNDSGTKTKRNSTWKPSTLHGILKNEAKYKGGQRGNSGKRWPIVLRG